MAVFALLMFGKESTIGPNLSIKESLSEKCVIGECCKWRVIDLVESGLYALTRKPCAESKR